MDNQTTATPPSNTQPAPVPAASDQVAPAAPTASEPVAPTPNAPAPASVPPAANTTQVFKQEPQNAPKKKNPLLLIIFIVLLLGLVAVGVYYFLYKPVTSPRHLIIEKQATNTIVKEATPTAQPTPTPNLNPNTGNLYTDIQSRLDQVIK